MGSSVLNSGTEYTALGHELAHSLDRIRGTLDKGIWFKTKDEDKTKDKDVRFAELFSTFIENKIRKEHGLELRTRYLDGGLIDGVDDSVVDEEGRSLYYDVNQNTRKNYRIVKKDQRYVF